MGSAINKLILLDTIIINITVVYYSIDCSWNNISASGPSGAELELNFYSFEKSVLLPYS